MAKFYLSENMAEDRASKDGQKDGVPESKSCFVISPIGSDGDPIRRRADQVFRYLIEPAVRPLGYAPERADHSPRPGLITQRVIREVAEADLVIADLTGHNPNVFYELAIRHGLQRPLVQMIDAADRIPFDVADMRTIKFDIRDLDSVEAAKQQLADQVKALEDEEEPLVTPISVARDMKSLWQSERPFAELLATVVSTMGSIQGEVRGLAQAQQRQQRDASTYITPDASALRRAGASFMAGDSIYKAGQLYSAEPVITAGQIFSGNLVTKAGEGYAIPRAFTAGASLYTSDDSIDVAAAEAARKKEQERKAEAKPKPKPKPKVRKPRPKPKAS